MSEEENTIKLTEIQRLAIVLLNKFIVLHSDPDKDLNEAKYDLTTLKSIINGTIPSETIRESEVMNFLNKIIIS